MNVIALPYASNISNLLDFFADADGLIYFHQGLNSSGRQWLSAWPTETYEYHGEQKIVQIDHDGARHTLADDWFAFLKHKTPFLPKTNGYFFTGGLAGHLSYDLGIELLNIKSQHPMGEQPLAVVGLYHWAINIDHDAKQSWLIIQQSCPVEINDKLAPLPDFLKANIGVKNTPEKLPAWQQQADSQAYERAFQAIKTYIEAGDCYQVNLTRQWLLAKDTLNDIVLYQKLSEQMPAPFSFFQRNLSHSVLSVSPERFLKIEQNRVLTQPIKGTIARGNSLIEDQENAEKLSNSEKDKAENLMIVDLLRNDIAKNAVAKSVTVDKLFEIQSFNYVHHLVSSISATLKPHTHPLDVLRDAFPGGSITGAPKKRAMEIIDELETINRGVYCGSAFYLNADGVLDSNILIRTVNLNSKGLSASAGGGIVFDSELESEFKESEVKIGKILAAVSG